MTSPSRIAYPHPLPNPNTCTLEELEVAMNCRRDNQIFRRLNASHFIVSWSELRHCIAQQSHQRPAVPSLDLPLQCMGIEKLGKASAKSSLTMKPGSKEIRGRLMNGSSVVRNPSMPIRGFTSSRMSPLRHPPADHAGGRTHHHEPSRH